MKKTKSQTHYACSECGQSHAKWFGKCSGCHQWNTLVEEQQISSNHESFSRNFLKTQNKNLDQNYNANAVKITDIKPEAHNRLTTGVDEFDRVLGGGLVPGSVILLGGEPGVGKSTLLLTTLFHLTKNNQKVLYLSAEESLSQIRLSAERLDTLSDNLFLFAENNLNACLTQVEKINPKVLVVDSIQTFYVPELESAPGSVSQIREVSHKIINLAKQLNLPIFLIGHITKEGSIAGPKMLEHMVDTVLYFENTRAGQYRILRSHKNRFGSTNEMGVFEMRGSGLAEVTNPSALFLKERPQNKPGSGVAISMEGTRPLLVEVQALTVSSPFGNPRRTTQGIDSTRCALIAAVLERRAGLNLAGHDLFINIAGGVNLVETASDLPVALAIASSLLNRPIRHDIACFGELGLSGEVRSVAHVENRIKEALQLGFNKIMLPQASTQQISNKLPDGIEIYPVKHLDQALELALQ